MTGVIVIFKSDTMLKRELSLTCMLMAAPSQVSYTERQPNNH